MALMQLAKGQGITVFVIGHVNKEGSIAGPKVLEHMVDCVLYFEGDQHMTYRILRAAKNRFGATNEIGVFEMMDRGLKEVENPSEMLLSGRPADAPGTCVTCVMEGARPVHRPDHFGLSLPHSVQKKTVFAFILSLFRTVLQQPGQNGRGQPPLVLLGLQMRGFLVV